MGKGVFVLPRFLRKLLSHPSDIFEVTFHQKRSKRGYLGLLLYPDQHAQEHVKSKEWSGSSYANFPSVIFEAARVVAEGIPQKHRHTTSNV